MLTEQARQAQHAGAAVDVWLLDDLLAGVMPGYNMYVFADAFALSESQRNALRQKLAEAGGTAIWLYGAGAIEEAVGGASMRDLMGIGPTVATKAGPLRVVIPPGDPLLSPQATAPLEYGLVGEVSPRFLIVDGMAEPLGKLKGTSWTGLARVALEGGRSVYSVAPGLPASVLTRFAEDSGVTVLTSAGTQVCGRNAIVCLVGTEAHEKISLQLPPGCSGIDLATGVPLPQQGSRIELELPLGEALTIKLVESPQGP